LNIFIDFGVFNRAGKTVSKIGIYALPPLKSEFYEQFIIKSIKIGFWHRFLIVYCFCMWRFSIYENWRKKNEIVFLFFLLVFFLCVVVVFFSCWSNQNPKQRMSVGPQKGAIQAQSQAIYRDLNHDGFNLLPTEPRWVLISHYSIDQAQT
jgi:magnesium-transporting ATPase (P-type)